MNGALARASIRFAGVVALGFLVAVSSSQAADVGGNCCADLEERISELEATTARKSHRKVALTVTGQVNRSVIWYDDGHSSTTYYGLDNTNSSSRFIFKGTARVTPKVTMGFEIMIEIDAGGTSSKVSQFDEDEKVGAQISGSAAPGASFNQSNLDAYMGDARRVAWWIEHADVGRLMVGRWENAGVPGTVDLTGHVFLAAYASFAQLNGGFFIRGPQGQYYSMKWSNISDPALNESSRTELIRYDGPSWHGFIYSASIAEAGDYWGTRVRYANDFNGVQLAGIVGYEKIKDRETPSTIDPTAAFWTGAAPNITAIGFALSAMHMPTGLFIQGHWNHVDYDSPNHVTSGYWGDSGGTTQKPSTQWLIQAGISKNFLGYGATSVYAEYGQALDWGASGAGRDFAGTSATSGCPGANSVCTPAIANFVPVNGVISTTETMWGLGIVQKFNSAATDLYLGYRHFDADITCTGAATAQGACAGAAGGGAKKLPSEGIDVVVSGARVLF